MRPPQGIVSARQAYYADFGPIETPDAATVVFKLKTPVAGVLPLLASPFNCIYSAAKLAQNPQYPETEIMGSGAFMFVEHVQRPHWTRQALRPVFQAGAALPRRLQGVLREVGNPSCRACSAASSTPSSASDAHERDQLVAEDGRQGLGEGAAAGIGADHHLQHQAQAVRRPARAPGAVPGGRPLDGRRGARQDLRHPYIGGAVRRATRWRCPRASSSSCRVTARTRRGTRGGDGAPQGGRDRAASRSSSTTVPAPTPTRRPVSISSINGGGSASRRSTSSSRPRSTSRPCRTAVSMSQSSSSPTITDDPTAQFTKLCRERRLPWDIPITRTARSTSSTRPSGALSIPPSGRRIVNELDTLHVHGSQRRAVPVVSAHRRHAEAGQGLVRHAQPLSRAGPVGRLAGALTRGLLEAGHPQRRRGLSRLHGAAKCSRRDRRPACGAHPSGSPCSRMCRS